MRIHWVHEGAILEAVQVDSGDIARFYKTSIVGLAALDAQAPVARGLGPDADARWNAFCGALDAWGRIDLLVRDAAVMHPAGCAPPGRVRGCRHWRTDEPLGPGWMGVEPAMATDLLRGAIASLAVDRNTGIVETLPREEESWGPSTAGAAAISFANVGPTAIPNTSHAAAVASARAVP